MALLRLLSVPQRGVGVALLLTWAGAAQAQPERMGGMVLLRLSPALQQRLLPEQRPAGAAPQLPGSAARC